MPARLGSEAVVRLVAIPPSVLLELYEALVKRQQREVGASGCLPAVLKLGRVSRDARCPRLATLF